MSRRRRAHTGAALRVGDVRDALGEGGRVVEGNDVACLAVDDLLPISASDVQIPRVCVPQLDLSNQRRHNMLSKLRHSRTSAGIRLELGGWV